MKKVIVGISAEGSVVLLEGQLRHFRERGYDTYLLSPDSDRVRDYCRKEGCTHLKINIRRDISPFHDLIILLKIIRLFYCYKPDIINLGTPKVALLGMIAGRILGIRKRIYTCRGFRFEHESGIRRKILVLMEKITAQCAHEVICISPSLRDFGIENGLFAREKAVVISRGSSNGFNLKRFSPQNIPGDSVRQLKKELGIENKFVFGFVGRIYDRKGICELCNAFSGLCNSLTDIILLIVGSFEEKQIADKRIIDLIGSHKQIKHVGSQKNIPLYLSAMDVFVMPGWGEGFGNVLVEAAALGIPVISTNAVGTKDTLVHKYNGLLIEPGSVEALTRAMILLYKDKEERKRMGRNGIEWARNFDNNIIWQGMEEIYNSVSV